MSKQVRIRRGTTAQHATFTGVSGEITVDTTLASLRVHDGSTAGGRLLARADGAGASGTWGISISGNAATATVAGGLSGTLAVGGGGTGATTPSGARSNLGAAASGANGDITSLLQSTAVNESGSITSSSIGFRGIPQNSQGGAYALALGDAGKHISISTGGVTIPANSSVAFPIGTTIVVFNDSGSPQNLAITSDTLRLAGTALTGTRSIAARGLCTLLKVGATGWVVSGAGLS